MSNLEEQLSAETDERIQTAQANRKQEKKINDLQLELEEQAAEHKEQFNEQNEKSNNRVKAMRRELDQAEDEISREKAHKRKVGHFLINY